MGDDNPFYVQGRVRGRVIVSGFVEEKQLLLNVMRLCYADP